MSTASYEVKLFPSGEVLRVTCTDVGIAEDTDNVFDFWAEDEKGRRVTVAMVPVSCVLYVRRMVE